MDPTTIKTGGACEGMAPLSLSRQRCARCRRALQGCWCACVRPVHNPIHLLILQHPDETHQAKNTATLLHRCLSNSTLQVGEQFEPPHHTAGLALLYPGTPGDTLLPAPAAWPSAPSGIPIHTLITLDATWRKSRRMLHENPWLAALPRMSLRSTPPSRYVIRRARGDDQRSTLEACALALAQLDGDNAVAPVDGGSDADISQRYAPLWEAMEAFVALHQRMTREGRARRAHEADRNE